MKELRGTIDFRLNCVEIGLSKIEGKGLFCNITADKEATLFEADLAEVGEKQGYTPDLYSDMKHIKHKDEDSVMLIDGGETMVATHGACIEDVKMTYIRAMNHLADPKREQRRGEKDEATANVQLVFGETTKPRWYISAIPDLDYSLWYRCSVVAAKPILPGDELTFAYDYAPKHWALSRREGSETTGARVGGVGAKET